VVVKVDSHMVSHSIGIIGVIFQMKTSGGARIATVAGLLSSTIRKGVQWIQFDQYVLKCCTNEHANIPAELEIIRQSILLAKYND
jgi:hypothetical protein